MHALEKTLGYQFKNSALLTLALTHPSLGKGENNQRLEFLGDAVLGLAVAKILYELFPAEQEGELARRLAALVRGETLAQVARDISLGEHLAMTESESQAGGRSNPTNLEDAMEALLGALYLDGGLPAAEQFILPRWSALAKSVAIAPKDAKTALQEWAQAKGLAVPTYTLKATTGLAHAPEFTIEVTVQGYSSVEAKAASKRAAEQLAAGLLLKQVSHA